MSINGSLGSPLATERQKELEEKGFRVSNRRNCKVRGRNVQKVDYTKNEVTSVGNRIKYLARTIGYGLLGGIPFTTKEGRDATINPLFRGRAKETLDVDMGEEDPEELEETLNYNPKNPASIREYVDRPDIRKRLLQADGNYFLPEQRRNGVSSFLFVPKGDFSKATSIVVFNAKDGSSVTNYAELMRSIRTFSASKENIDEAWEKKLKNLAQDLKKSLSNHSDKDNLDKLRKSLNKQKGIIVIDVKNFEARIYSKDSDLNVDMNSYKTGTSISLSDATKEAIRTVHGKSMKSDQKLEGDKPFKKEIPSAPIEMPLSDE
jgi:hypothetical protein